MFLIKDSTQIKINEKAILLKVEMVKSYKSEVNCTLYCIKIRALAF